MKKCTKCGKSIINGENGCMIMDICFTCNGGYPQYNKKSIKFTQTADEAYEEMNTLETLANKALKGEYYGNDQRFVIQ